MMSTRRIGAALVTAGLLAQTTPVSAAPSGGALPPPLTLLLSVADDVVVPSDAIGVAVNITVTEPIAAGFVTVYPCGERPLASNLNYVAGQTVANFVVVGVDDDGDICIDTMSTTDLVIDLVGYVPAGSPVVPLAAPERFLDTREGRGAPRGRVAGLTVLEVAVAGALGVPVDAESIVFNATAVQPDGPGFLTVFPCGQPVPETSTLNFASGAVVANLVVSAVGVDGKVCFFSNVSTDIVADVAAYVVGGDDGLATLVRPHRLVDTRVGLGGPTAPIGPPSRSIQISGQVGIPADATAAIVNLTATNGRDTGYAAAYPCGGVVPFVSSLNFAPGTTAANLAIVALGPDGTMCLTASRDVDAIVDVLGYVQGADAVVPVAPERLYDSRIGVDPHCAFALGWAQANQALGSFVMYPTNGAPPITLPEQPAWQSRGNGYIDPFCGVHLTGYADNGLYVADYLPSGVAVGRYRVFGLPFRSGAATATGLLAMRADQTTTVITDVSADRTIVSVPNEGWTWIGATDDGSLMAMWRWLPDRSVEVRYWDQDGVDLGAAVLSPDFVPVDISNDGSYLVSVVRADGPNNPGELRVTTLVGDFVASYTTAPSSQYTSEARFLTDGSVLVCVNPHGFTPVQWLRWDLFGPARPVGGIGWPTTCSGVQDAR